MAKIFKPQNRVKKRKHQSIAKQMADFTGRVQHYDHHGKGILKLDSGHVAFVPGVMQGEEVRVRPTTYTDNVIHGQAIEITTPSPKRISAHCSHFGNCGGCQLQYMANQEQVEIKQAALSRLFNSQLKLSHLPWQPAIVGPDWGYRRTARLVTWVDNKGTVLLGFRRSNDKQIVDIEQCPVLVEALAQRLIAIKPVLAQLHDMRKITHVQVLYLSDVCHLILRTMGALNEGDKTILTEFAKENSCQLALEYDKHQYESLSTVQQDQELLLEYALDGLTFNFQPQDFIQINEEVNRQMVAQALDWLNLDSEDTVLDLFAGVGNFTLPLAKRVKQVMAVEGVNDMVKRLKYNAELNRISNVSAHQADLSKFDHKRPPRWLKPIDKLLLDPARDGAYAVIKKIPLLNPKQILYVSCNPATMVRDVKHLLSTDYRLTKIGLLNMFPHTSHIEAMALLEK